MNDKPCLHSPNHRTWDLAILYIEMKGWMSGHLLCCSLVSWGHNFFCVVAVAPPTPPSEMLFIQTLTRCKEINIIYCKDVWCFYFFVYSLNSKWKPFTWIIGYTTFYGQNVSKMLHRLMKHANTDIDSIYSVKSWILYQFQQIKFGSKKLK